MRGKCEAASSWPLEHHHILADAALVMPPQASISSRRRASASDRRYASSALSQLTWANACSKSSRAICVSLPGQSRNERRNACAVKGDPMRRNSISNSMSESGRTVADIEGRAQTLVTLPSFKVEFLRLRRHSSSAMGNGSMPMPAHHEASSP